MLRATALPARNAGAVRRAAIIADEPWVYI
jgi:hypothetical protein